MPMNPKDFDDSEKKMLENKAKEVVEAITEETDTNSNPCHQFIQEQNKDGKETPKIPRVWDPRETDFLINNRTNMSNKEIKEFLEGDSEIHEHKDDLKKFSSTEERFIRENFAHLDNEKIAEKLGKEEKVIELKAKLMGLRTH